MQRTLIRFTIRLLAATLVFAGITVVTQDVQIFPGVTFGMFGSAQKGPPPSDVEPLKVSTTDGEVISVWRREAAPTSERIVLSSGPSGERKRVAVLLHGNGDTLQNFVVLQRWLGSLGFVTYSLDYRGFGESTGWPSEAGLYRDGEAVVDLALKREHATPSDLLILGLSIGSGPAAYLADHYRPGTLVLLSPYAALDRLVSEMPFLGYFTPFLRYRFPTAEYVGRLDSTCVVAAHGRLDTTIPYHHAEWVRDAYRGSGGFTLIESPAAGHNDLFARSVEDISEAIGRCLNHTGTAEQIKAS